MKIFTISFLNKSFFISAFLILPFTSGKATAQTLVVPPSPGDLVAAGVKHLTQSADYMVEVKKSGVANYTSCFVYKTDNWASNHFGSEHRVQESASFTNFSFSNTTVDVKITVIKPGLTANSVTIRPLNYGITPVLNGNVITFTLTTPRKISVEVNNRLNPLFLFADEPDVVPDPTTVAQYYGPGVHNIGLHKQINSGETVYIAGGAVLQGTFYIPTGSNGITVRGRGIISGGLLPTADERTGGAGLPNTTPSIDSIQKYAVFTGKKDKYGTTILYNLSFEGFTMVNTCGTHFAMVNTNHQNHNNTFRNLKEVDWSVNTDNVFDGDNNIVDDCFFFINDDCIVTRASNNLRITNLTYWGGQCGRLMWHQNYGSSDGVLFDNINVIGHDGEQYVFKFTPHTVYGEMKNFTFKNMRIEEHPYGGVYPVKNSYMTNKFISINSIKNGVGTLKVSNWLFENITVDDQNANEGDFTANSTATIDVTFKNLKMAGTLITSLEAANMTANAFSDIKFIVSPTTTTTESVKPNTSSLMNLYPNPAKDHVNIDYQATYGQPVKVEILDLHNRCVATHNFYASNSGKNTNQVIIPSLSGGSYFVKTTINKGISYTQKLFIQ